MLLRWAYLTMTHAFAAVRLRPRSGRDKGVETLALRHQLAVLERQLHKARPRFTPEDRALLAALLHHLPNPRSIGQLATQGLDMNARGCLLAWERWTCLGFHSASPGRHPLDALFPCRHGMAVRATFDGPNLMADAGLFPRSVWPSGCGRST